MYEFMKETVVLSAFIFILFLDIFSIGYWIVRFANWVRKARRKEKAERK